MSDNKTPWTVKVRCLCSNLEETSYGHFVVIGGCSHLIAVTVSKNYESIKEEPLLDGDVRRTGVNYLKHDTTPHPDALLAAAAPDLFEACTTMLNEIRAYQGESEFEEGSPVKSWCDMLKAAIAKAKP